MSTKGEKISRPRREKNAMERALLYAKLHKGGKGLSANQLSKKYNEHTVMVYKLIRLGEAPKSVHDLIKQKEIPATVVHNMITASMSAKEVEAVVKAEVARRRKIRQEMHEAGFKGASSLTIRRTLNLAIANLKKRHMIKTEGQKAVVRVFTRLFGGEDKPSVQDAERAMMTA